MARISCSVCPIQNLLDLLNCSWVSAYMHDDIIDTIWITDKKLLHFKLSKSGKILRVDKTGFPSPSLLYIYRAFCLSHQTCVEHIKWAKSSLYI